MSNNNNNNKMKGLLKGLRYISQIFGMTLILTGSIKDVFFQITCSYSYSLEYNADNEKEPEMQIGYPTDVKHVAHIGWDGPSVNSPSWMNEFKAAPGLSSASNGDANDEIKWVSEDAASRRVSRRASDSSARDLPELPKSSRRHSSTGGAGDSPTKEKSDKPKQSRRSSRNANKELADGKSGRHKDSGPAGASEDAPKKTRRKKSKDGSMSKSSRSKAQASDVDCGSESGSVSKSLSIGNCDSALDEDAENGFTGIS
ncbi:hypothetical protein P3X46_017807 [Hevea brasiliensis]|uniref:CRIB domain-containing protein n=1 Tax=Hevea brasiliensis TaxID=3981 RepID=A0ABQ9LSS9_HEVBR|nr:hypothetical protein P3X46_017807 [Hevea brasiliensis]